MASERTKKLLTPLTDEQAASIQLVTRKEIDEALRKLDRPSYGRRLPTGRYL